MICSIQDCTNKLHSKNYCSKHKWRLLKYGDPNYLAFARDGSWDRIWDKIDFNGPEYLDKGPCWLWIGNLTNKGYARTSFVGVNIQVHQLTYAWLNGEVPRLTTDHLCRNRNCVNPYHLEDITNHENILRGNGDYNKFKTQCPQGHPYNSDNTIVYKGHRSCRECNRERLRIRWITKGY